MTAKTKVCSHCGQAKPLDQFSKDRSTKDGLHHWDKVCLAAYWKAKRDAKKAANEELATDLTAGIPHTATAADDERRKARNEAQRARRAAAKAKAASAA